MKICLINNLYKPYCRGGSERVIEIAIDEFTKHHQLLLLTTQPNDLLNTPPSGNLRVFRFKPRNLYYLLDDFKMPRWKKFLWHFFDMFNKSELPIIRREIGNFQPQIIITHNLKGMGLQIFKIVKRFKAIHVHVLHDYQLIDPHGSLHRQSQNLTKIGLLYQLYLYITKRLVNTPDLVISPSKFVLNKHLEHGFFKHVKTAVLPNPCLPRLIGEKIKSEKEIKFLYLGQIEKHKGVEFLVETFMKWPNRQSRLTIAGGGSRLNYVIGLAKNDRRIKILGKVNRTATDHLFMENDVLVVPSIWWENSPTVIYEAYNNKTPVLVSDSGGSKELVIENQTGWIFKSNDENDLLEKMDHLFLIKENLKYFGENGYKFGQQFSAEKYVEKLLELCQTLKK